MKITLEKTDVIIEMVQDRAIIEARLWEGQTENGIRIQALIPRIAVHKDSDLSQFERELKEMRAPSIDFQGAFPLRMIL